MTLKQIENQGLNILLFPMWRCTMEKLNLTFINKNVVDGPAANQSSNLKFKIQTFSTHKRSYDSQPLIDAHDDTTEKTILSRVVSSTNNKWY